MDVLVDEFVELEEELDEFVELEEELEELVDEEVDLCFVVFGSNNTFSLDELFRSREDLVLLDRPDP